MAKRLFLGDIMTDFQIAFLFGIAIVIFMTWLVQMSEGAFVFLAVVLGTVATVAAFNIFCCSKSFIFVAF